MKKTIVQGLWIGDSLSDMERTSINSFLANGCEYHLYTYSTISNIPSKAIIKDANKIIPESRIFKYKDNGSYAGFADLFRDKLLLEHGNYWADSDMICVSPLDTSEDHIFAAQNCQTYGSKARQTIKMSLFPLLPLKRKIKLGLLNINNCFIRAPKGSEVMEYCYKKANSADDSTLKWGQTGPKLLTEAVEKFDMYDSVEDITSYCPIKPKEWFKLIEGNGAQYHNLLKNAKAVHLWNEYWRQNNIDKNSNFDEHCLYQTWKNKYLNYS